MRVTIEAPGVIGEAQGVGVGARAEGGNGPPHEIVRGLANDDERAQLALAPRTSHGLKVSGGDGVFPAASRATDPVVKGGRIVRAHSSR